MMLMERGLRLGLMGSRKRRRRNIYYGDGEDNSEKGKEQEVKKSNKNKSGGKSGGFMLRKCSTEIKKKQESTLKKIGGRVNLSEETSLRLGLTGSRKRRKIIYGDGEDNSKKLKRNNDGKSKSAGRGFRLRKCSTEIKKKQQQQQQPLKIGDRLNLSDILFTRQRDYLITYNDRDRPVGAKHLEDKFIILNFVPLTPWSHRLGLFITSLVEIYNALHPKGGLEVVFIGLKYGKFASNPRKLCKSFEKRFSTMPWTAIPDIKSPRYWERILRFPLSNFIGESDTCSFVIDPTGVLLSYRPDVYFADFGAEAFPFTEDKIDLLISQDEEALKHPTITALLTSPDRDYLINNKGQAVPVHTLEDKVVALYFFEEYLCDILTGVIKPVYQQLANAQIFEIVFVYVHDSLVTWRDASEDLFWAHFTDMPWLALPFKDPKSKNLRRIFNIPMDVLEQEPNPCLVIVGPQGKFFEPYGFDILKMYGASAYPFTRKRAAEVDAEFARNLKLDKILDPNTSFTQENGPNVKLSQLLGKKIILVVDGLMRTATPEFWQNLRARYLEMKDTDAKFEVIHIHTVIRVWDRDLGPYNLGPYSKHVGETTSWLSHPLFHEESHISKLFFRLFRQRVGLLAFDCDGRVVRKTVFPSIERGNMDFPFHAGGLEEVALVDLVERYNWDYFWLG